MDSATIRPDSTEFGCESGGCASSSWLAHAGIVAGQPVHFLLQASLCFAKEGMVQPRRAWGQFLFAFETWVPPPSIFEKLGFLL